MKNSLGNSLRNSFIRGKNSSSRKSSDVKLSLRDDNKIDEQNTVTEHRKQVAQRMKKLTGIGPKPLHLS